MNLQFSLAFEIFSILQFFIFLFAPTARNFYCDSKILLWRRRRMSRVSLSGRYQVQSVKRFDSNYSKNTTLQVEIKQINTYRVSKFDLNKKNSNKYWVDNIGNEVILIRYWRERDKPWEMIYFFVMRTLNFKACRFIDMALYDFL